ncbi:MAG TPA: SDR family oxidoreductase [Pirellulales bacterium]|nr:SDR family oxidoreductase [Pirellulales bacterium]
MSLLGKTALVTGASRGIGRGVAIGLAQAGADVAINYHSHPEEAESAAEEVRRAGRRAVTISADVADHEVVEEMVRRVIAEFGRLDVAVSNAVYSDREPFYEADLAGFKRTVDVTMWGAFHLLRAAARQMIAQGGGGTIVFISSPHAYVPVPRSMAYNMSKAATDQMARTAAIELIDHRIRVNTIHPGWIDTPGERKFVTEDQIRQFGEKMLWKRLGRPDEIARGVVFLCDPASDYINGAELLIDGGNTLPWWAKGGMGVPR